MKNKKQKGFTLIELLVVIAIIGILAAIGLSALTSARKKARDSKRKSDLREVATAVELYYADKGNYPKVDTFDKLLTELKTGQYIDRNISDPLTSRRYCYKYSSSTAIAGLYYLVGSKLEVTSDASSANDGGPDDNLYEVGNSTGDNKTKADVGDCSGM